MRPKHTPGPWVINGDEIHDRKMHRDEHGAWIGDRPNRIVTIDYIMPEETADANAALIAAAPELLEALEWAVTALAKINPAIPRTYDQRDYALAVKVIQRAKQ